MLFLDGKEVLCHWSRVARQR